MGGKWRQLCLKNNLKRKGKKAWNFTILQNYPPTRCLVHTSNSLNPDKASPTTPVHTHGCVCTHLRCLLVNCFPKLFSTMTSVIWKAGLTENCIYPGHLSLGSAQPQASAPLALSPGFGANILFGSVFSHAQAVIRYFSKKSIKKKTRLLSLP